MSSSSVKASVAIIGGTGGLGEHVSNAFLTEFRTSFPTVRIISRDPNSAKAQGLAQKGAELAAFDALAEAVSGVDVVVDVLPPATSEEARRKVIETAIKGGPKVYFLSEFGVDQRIHDFPGYEHEAFVIKKRLEAHAREVSQGKTKVIATYTGPFLEILLGPYLGFDLEKNVFTLYGPVDQRFATTAQSDIGRSLARLALLSLDPATASKVPDNVRIAGALVSYEDVRDILSRVKGVPKAEIKSEDLGKIKEGLRDKGGDFLTYVRVLFGENKLNWTQNENELVNPGQSLWKWKTVEDQIRAAL